ncbi:MAG TPA: hypothetical protein VN493_24670 [Thermoanaerobaculia bacterium]|nr:hypothetical protein [Thermoanaerobaculia bacterium]
MRTAFRNGLAGVALLAITASPALAAGHEGTYRIQNQTLTVQVKIGLKSGTRSETIQMQRRFDVRGGQLPANAFAKEKDVWSNRIATWRLWPKQREIVAVAAVHRAYDDLLRRVNEQLRCFADRMTVRQTGVFSANLQLVDTQCSRTANLPASFDSSRGTFAAARLNPGDLAFRPGWLLLGGSTAALNGSLPQGQMKWKVDAALLGATATGGAVNVGLKLEGVSVLSRVP